MTPALVSSAARRASRARWGLLLLAAFDLVVAWVTFGFGATDIMLLSLLSAGLLVVAALQASQRTNVAALALVGVALATLLRAVPQYGGSLDVGDVARFAVPIGFVLAVAQARFGPPWLALAGVVAVALARSYFVIFYVGVGATTLVVGNALGAVGAWLWATALMPPREGQPLEDAAPAGAASADAASAEA